MVITGLEHRATIFPRIIAGGNYSKEAPLKTALASWAPSINIIIVIIIISSNNNNNNNTFIRR